MAASLCRSSRRRLRRWYRSQLKIQTRRMASPQKKRMSEILSILLRPGEWDAGAATGSVMLKKGEGWSNIVDEVGGDCGLDV